MVQTTINNDTTTQWEIDGDNTLWTLRKKAEISVHGTAIDVLATSEGNEIRLMGDVAATGALVSKAVAVAGAETTILVGDKSEISGRTGIFNTAEDFTLINQGEIGGTKYGVISDKAAVIRNTGSISGDTAIKSIGETRIVNGKAGEISGDIIGIEISTDYSGTVINRGTISGGDVAIEITTLGSTTVKNSGMIEGDVVFGNGHDLIDTRKGTIDGEIFGGWGSDVYRIADSDLYIVEYAGQGEDRVESRVSYELSDNLENLVLKGKADISATGNGEDNHLYGNSGENTLVGGAGDDVLNGSSGNDLLIGDAGEDLFVFQRGTDRDSVADFEQGFDEILMIFDIEEINEFSDIEGNISQHGNDVWISMGQGDRLILLNTDIGDVDETDFTFSNISVA